MEPLVRPMDWLSSVRHLRRLARLISPTNRPVKAGCVVAVGRGCVHCPGVGSRGDWPYILLPASIFLAFVSLHLFTIRRIFNRNMRGENYSDSSRWLLLLLLGAAIFGVTLLLQPALFSDDVFRYIFSGRMLTIYH